MSAQQSEMPLLLTRIGTLQLLGGLVFFIRTKVLALALGPEGTGLVSVIDQFVQVAMQLSAFAIPFAALMVLSKAHSESMDAFRATYAYLLRVLLILGTLGATIGVALVFFRPSWISASLVAHAPVAAIGVLALPAIILHGFFRNVPAAAARPLAAAVWDFITAAIMTGTVTIGILLFAVPGYFVGALVGGVAVSVAYYVYLGRQFGVSIAGPPGSIRGFLKAYPSFVEVSLTSYAVAFIAPLAQFVVRTTVLENFGAASAGLLQAALGISLAIHLVLSRLNGLVLTPLVNRTLADGIKHREAVAFQKKILLAIAVASLPPCLFPDLVVTVLYSSEFVEVNQALYWFVLSQAMMQICGVYASLMIGLNRLKAYALVMVVGTAANAVLAVLLVPRLGLSGAGIAAFASATLLCLGTFGYLRIREGFELGRTVGLATLLLFVGLGLAGAFIGTRPSLELPNFLVKSLVCLVAIGLMVPLSLDRNAWRTIFGVFGWGR